MNTVNPKGTLFMLAVVPQFIEPAQSLLPQSLATCTTLAFTVINVGYTAFAARLLGARRTPRRLQWRNRVFGGLFIGLATVKR